MLAKIPMIGMSSMRSGVWMRLTRCWTSTWRDAACVNGGAAVCEEKKLSQGTQRLIIHGKSMSRSNWKVSQFADGEKGE